MAASPQYKVYNPSNEYVASCKCPSDAAALAALYGEGATVRLGHGSAMLWAEGHETQSAGESYDYAAGVILDRHEAIMQRAFNRNTS